MFKHFRPGLRGLVGLAMLMAIVAGTLSLGTGPASARDRDNNPPGQVGGPGTNWENPRGPVGGPGASPNRPHR
ncbi:hypothetical protein [Leptolyngbya sp. 'hensonii']|uniref:hypothetical protein n=1 Tax=Leptolyngbya sp. 'hensonii' TaxID=1922337 RepID=UPI000A3F3B79|nr:hypothetical protein [Leptolyngbya sp. 'hensonii']